MYSWLYISLHHLFLNKTFWRNHTKPNFPPTSKLPKTSPRCLFVPNIPIFFGVQLRSAPGKFLEVHLGRWMTTHQRWDVFFQWASRTVRSPLVSISRKRTANCDKVGFVFSPKNVELFRESFNLNVCVRVSFFDQTIQLYMYLPLNPLDDSNGTSLSVKSGLPSRRTMDISVKLNKPLSSLSAP